MGRESEEKRARFGAPISELYRLVSEIDVNVTFMQREVDTLDVSQGVKEQVLAVCEQFRSTLYDVKKETRTLEDKLGMHSGEEPFDPDVVNRDPVSTMGFIEQWLQQDIEILHKLIKRLEESKGSDGSVVFVLCAESGVNILNSYRGIKEALALIRQGLP